MSYCGGLSSESFLVGKIAKTVIIFLPIVGADSASYLLKLIRFGVLFVEVNKKDLNRQSRQLLDKLNILKRQINELNESMKIRHFYGTKQLFLLIIVQHFLAKP